MIEAWRVMRGTDVKKQSDSEALLKAEPTKFAEGLDVSMEERVKGDCKFSCLAERSCP